MANRGRSGAIYRQMPLTDRLCQFCVNEIEDEKHFICSCPQYEDLKESIRAIRKAENITKDTLLTVTFRNEFETQVYCYICI